MPLKLIPPQEGRSKVYRVRGTHRGVSVDRSTGVAPSEKRAVARAQAFLDRWTEQIERGELTGKAPLTFAAATVAFVQGGGENRFLRKITDHLGPRVAAIDVDQAAIDDMADKLYPGAAPATKRRQVHAPVNAILRHNGISFVMRWPKGSQGNHREVWLSPDQAERVIAEAAEINVRLGTLMLLGLYTGMRLGEMLGLTWADISLDQQTATVLRTKNGDPRVAYLPPRVCAALMSQIPASSDVEKRDIGENRVFGFTRNGRLNDMAHRAYTAAGVDPGDAPFHCLRHTYATWMTRLGADLIGAKVWRSQTSARRYTHFVVSEEARKADALPGANPCGIRAISAAAVGGSANAE